MIILFSSIASNTIFDFNKKADIGNWKIVDDGVMGGNSSSTITLNKEGFGVFKGTISLENNGGFSSVQHSFDKISVKNFSKIVLSVCGDGKTYEFRIKENAGDDYSYIAPFPTTGKWQEIEIELTDMYPSFRGRKLNQPNFSEAFIEQVTFLFGNKKEERFALLIDKIALQ